MIETPKRVARHIQPIGPRVLVRVIKSADLHESGLYLPAGAKDGHAEALYGEVVEVARAQADSLAVEDDKDLGTNVSGVPHGAFVLFPKSAGVKVPWNDDLRILSTKEVLATVEEVPLEETH